MKKKYWILLILCILVLSFDQWTKYAVQQSLPLHQRIEVIRGFFNLTHVRNTGGAFGILGGSRGGWGLLFFVTVSLVAIGSILFLFVKIREEGGRLPLLLLWFSAEPSVTSSTASGTER